MVVLRSEIIRVNRHDDNLGCFLGEDGPHLLGRIVPDLETAAAHQRARLLVADLTVGLGVVNFRCYFALGAFWLWSLFAASAALAQKAPAESSQELEKLLNSARALQQQAETDE